MPSVQPLAGVLCALLVCATAWAGPTQVGLHGTLGGGLAAGTWRPATGSQRVAAGGGYQASLGVWWGHYDSDYVLGRYWGTDLSMHHTFYGGGQRIGPALELRRGMDLIVLGLAMHLAVGPEWYQAPHTNDWQLGGVALVGGTIKYRPHRTIGPFVRMELGAALEDTQVVGRFNLVVGVDLAGPLGKRSQSGL